MRSKERVGSKYLGGRRQEEETLYAGLQLKAVYWWDCLLPTRKLMQNALQGSAHIGIHASTHIDIHVQLFL